MKRVILYGGSFDPIHKEHLRVASKASKILDADVWFILAKNPRWKDDVTLEGDRLNMLKIATSRFKRFSVCDIELKSNDEVTYTINTVYKLKNKYPEYRFYYLIGADQLDKLHDWKDIDELKDLVTFVCANRNGYKINEENLKKYNALKLNIYGDETSSTAIRENLSNNVPKRVKAYIDKYNVYLKEDIKKILSSRRYKHTLGVANIARTIALANGYDERKAYIAGLVHDCSKEIDKEVELDLMKKYFKEHLHEDPKIYHQYTGPIIAKNALGIEDEEILHSIRYHTTGCMNMSVLDKIVYIADKTDYNRGYDSSLYINKAIEDVHVGFAYLYVENIRFQKSKGIDPFINNESKDLLQTCLDIKEKYQLKLVIKLLNDKSSYDLKVIDIKERSPLNSFLVICEVNNERQAQAYASLVDEELSKNGFEVHHIEGRRDKQWVLLDAYDIIVHFLTSEGRENYKLDKIFGDSKEIPVEEILNYELR